MDRRGFIAAATAAGMAGAGLLAARPARAQLFGAPEPDLWPRWQAHDPASTAVVDHSAWTGLLGRHVRASPDGVNRVDYRAFESDRAALDDYVATLAGIPVSDYGRDEQFAYWVNLYNALTVQVVLDHYPVDSILDIDISPGWFSSGPWGADLVEVEGRPLTLDDIEHRILRPIWRDERVHYAVNCASIGCPNLRRRAFAGDRLEAMLRAGATDYVNHPRGAQVRDGGLRVSSIYVWFQEDFGNSDSGVIRHLRSHAAPEKAGRLNGLTRIAGHDYDWALNDTADGA
jgi:hypothetical protein